ncbi:MAG: PQQ-like beta-propeller repeat protein, partial [Planctomycetota bacterium]|nr:PQQ-like beta-propeller repeat protein [Planctomycetota bacterium]
MSRLLWWMCAMAIALWYGCSGTFADAAAAEKAVGVVAAAERGALSSPLAIERASAPLAKDSPMRVRWALDLKDRNAVRFWLPAPEVAVDYLLLLTDKNDLLAIRRRSGMVAWWTRLPGPPTGDIAFTDYSLYLVIRSHLVCLERNSGEVISRLMLPFPPSAGPAVFEGQERLPLIFIPSLDTKVYALEIDKTVWPSKFGWGAVQQSDFLMEDYILKIVWRWPAHELIAGNIIYHDRFVYLTDAKYNLYGILTTELQAGKPKTVRFFRTQGPMAVGPVISGPYIFVASRDRTLYCLARIDFGEVWRYPTGEILETAPAIMNDPYGNRTVVIQKCGKSGPLTGLLDTG